MRLATEKHTFRLPPQLGILLADVRIDARLEQLVLSGDV
jgi:hypothetical protein